MNILELPIKVKKWAYGTAAAIIIATLLYRWYRMQVKKEAERLLNEKKAKELKAKAATTKKEAAAIKKEIKEIDKEIKRKKNDLKIAEDNFKNRVKVSNLTEEAKLKKFKELFGEK
jgi:type VI protein secretion system component VasK